MLSNEIISQSFVGLIMCIQKRIQLLPRHLEVKLNCISPETASSPSSSYCAPRRRRENVSRLIQRSLLECHSASIAAGSKVSRYCEYNIREIIHFLIPNEFVDSSHRPITSNYSIWFLQIIFSNFISFI